VGIKAKSANKAL